MAGASCRMQKKLTSVIRAQRFLVEIIMLQKSKLMRQVVPERLRMRLISKNQTKKHNDQSAQKPRNAHLQKKNLNSSSI